MSAKSRCLILASTGHYRNLQMLAFAEQADRVAEGCDVADALRIVHEGYRMVDKMSADA